jgi:hypothetical protein
MCEWSVKRRGGKKRCDECRIEAHTRSYTYELIHTLSHNNAHTHRSYEATNLWSLLEEPPLGVRLDFVKAERSIFRWGGEDEERIRGLGHGVHLLKGSGHWVSGRGGEGVRGCGHWVSGGGCRKV